MVSVTLAANWLDFHMQTVLLTGAAGFIGAHTARALLEQGHSVVGVDNFDPFYDPRIKAAAVESLRKFADFRFVEADIADAGAMQRVFEGSHADGVIHLAAKAGVRPSIADPTAYARVNVLGTSIILAESLRAACTRVVVASSSSVYGNCPTAPFHEDLDVNAPISPYAATKRACELLGFTHHALTKQPVAMLRFFTVFGPGQRPDLAIMQFLKSVSKGETIRVFGDGSSSRDYTYVDDIVSGVLAAYDRIPSFGYRVWNLGGNEPTTLNSMVATIGRVVGREPVIQREAMQPGDVERTWADLTRSGSELGYAPRTGFEAGVRRQWASLGGSSGQ